MAIVRVGTCSSDRAKFLAKPYKTLATKQASQRVAHETLGIPTHHMKPCETLSNSYTRTAVTLVYFAEIQVYLGLPSTGRTFADHP